LEGSIEFVEMLVTVLSFLSLILVFKKALDNRFFDNKCHRISRLENKSHLPVVGSQPIISKSTPRWRWWRSLTPILDIDISIGLGKT